MTDRASARAARLAALLNADGTLTPAATLPEGLLVEPKEEVEAIYLKALTTHSVGEGFQAMRAESGLSTPEVLARRNLTKGRLSQLEQAELNPQLSTITQQADALDYDVSIVFTPRNKQRRAVQVSVKPVSSAR
jgi:hypothetical protein